MTDTTSVVGVRPDAHVERVHLDETAWVDVGRGWLSGADELFAALSRDVQWETTRLFRYDHWVEERRLSAGWRRGLPLPHPALAEIQRAIQQRYGVSFNGFGMMKYRDGRDGQAFHRDTDMRWLDDTIIAIVTLGARRPWLLRPKANRHSLAENKGATHDVSPASGDLLVMGGTCQLEWEHSVAYIPQQHVGPRISLQWRWTSRRGRPFMGASYSAPLTYRRR